MPTDHIEFAQRGNMSYNDFQAFQGHPFLQFTGIPSLPNNAEKRAFDKTDQDSITLGLWAIGTFIYEKPPNVFRIATIGGSTTANEYPKIMERIPE